MMYADSLPTWQKGQHSENAEQHDDGIEACALPITPAQMQPHAKFIKGQRHANAVKECAHASLFVVQPGKKAEFRRPWKAGKCRSSDDARECRRGGETGPACAEP